MQCRRGGGDIFQSRPLNIRHAHIAHTAPFGPQAQCQLSKILKRRGVENYPLLFFSGKFSLSSPQDAVLGLLWQLCNITLYGCAVCRTCYRLPITRWDGRVTIRFSQYAAPTFPGKSAEKVCQTKLRRTLQSIPIPPTPWVFVAILRGVP